MISVIVPILNEEGNIPSLLKEISAVGQKTPISEIIYVDDGSTDNSFNVLSALKNDYPYLRVIRHDRRSGQSAALWTGVKAASNHIIVTLDGDGQNDPADIALLYDHYIKYEKMPNTVMIVGQRKKRNDNVVRRISSRLANKIRSSLLKDKISDTGCSLKMFRRKDYLSLPYFNHMHRFLPALMLREQVQVVEVKVSHRARSSGTSKYGTLDRALVGILDLFGVWWLQQRANRHPQILETLS